MTIQELEALQKKLADQVESDGVIASICALQKAILDTKLMEIEYNRSRSTTGVCADG